MTNQCLRCGKPFDSWLHPCLSLTSVVHFDKYLQASEGLRVGNPLDRLTVEDMIRIDGQDPDQVMAEAEANLGKSHEEYLEGPLAFRVEIHDLIGAGFQGAFDYNAMECNSADESELERVLDFLFAGQSLLPHFQLDRSHIYLCRLVSLNREGIRYVWFTKKLTYDEQWKSSDWLT